MRSRGWVMSDSWHHTVRLVEIRRYEDAQVRFSNIGVELLSGEGACPPDDCGRGFGI